MEQTKCLPLPHQLNGYILLKALYKRHIAFANSIATANAIAMANRSCDSRLFCGATERIRNAGAKCLEVPHCRWGRGNGKRRKVSGKWAGVSTPSVAITPLLTWHCTIPPGIPDPRTRIPNPEGSDTDTYGYWRRRPPSPPLPPPQDGPDKHCYLFRICLPFPVLFMFGRRQFSWRWMQLSCVGHSAGWQRVASSFGFLLAADSAVSGESETKKKKPRSKQPPTPKLLKQATLNCGLKLPAHLWLS